ncbi:MAG: acyl-ACP--UDP-N-acetylglucosamine O-acyltransferase [Phycisphaerae bacterium]
MPKIAPSAHIDKGARIADDVEIGPLCYVGPHVSLGPGCRLLPQATILGHTEIGARTTIFPGAVLGGIPQDLKYRGTDTRLIIGDDNVFREHVTIHPGTETGGGETRIGDHNQFQIGVHIAHDVRVGDNCVLSNSVQIAGHVVIEDAVNISGLVGVQQFVTLGKFSFVAGATRCAADVPPFLVFAGFEGLVVSVNEEGMRRWGFVDEDIRKVWDLYKTVFSKKAGRSGETLASRIASAESNGSLTEHTRYLLDFVKRSHHDGVFGRYLEAKRRDVAAPPPAFYRG